MSKIGYNIKKIRGIKNLNQSDFANLFDLKRASIGAYEEGRAEPKLSTIIEIANYFSISIDDLVTKEMSINDFYRLDIFKEDLHNSAKHNLTPNQPLQPTTSRAWLLDQEKQDLFIKNTLNYNELDSIKIPGSFPSNSLAIEVTDNSMKLNDQGIQSGDYLIVKEQPNQLTSKILIPGNTYLFTKQNAVMVREFVSISLSEITLKAWSNPNTYITLPLDSNFKVYEILLFFSKNITKPNHQESRITTLEKDVESIKQSIKHLLNE